LEAAIKDIDEEEIKLDHLVKGHSNKAHVTMEDNNQGKNKSEDGMFDSSNLQQNNKIFELKFDDP